MEQMTIVLSKFESHDEETFKHKRKSGLNIQKSFQMQQELSTTGLTKSRKMGFTILE